ncbi:MAG: type II toxin-antitoxin system VapC family toxin [Anaerolineae bacterium]|nr:type II toxin-antitoxin system VapC family toxin [Anaerolineae bacterium]
MKLLLDTHTFLWFISKSPKITLEARNQITDNPDQLFLSIVSLWEIAIKVSIGKLTLQQPFETLFPHQLRINGIKQLEVSVSHTALVSKLPFHHNDPFDRMLIAQAITENVAIISADKAFDAYGVDRLW